MPLFRKAIEDLNWGDIESLVRDEVIEDLEVEFKRELELEPSGRVKESSRNNIARELVAFANSDGGTLIVGIEESEDDPKRAAGLRPMPDCQALAERLRRAVIEVIEPKLSLLHARALESQTGDGVLVFQVDRSLRAPHRVEGGLRESFRRVGSESRKMTMREVQELTLAIAGEASRIEARFESPRIVYRKG